MLLTHLTTFIMMLQDERVSAGNYSPNEHAFTVVIVFSRTRLDGCNRCECRQRTLDTILHSVAHDPSNVDMLFHTQLNPEERLLRVLLRTDCDGVRKSMLQDQLQLPNHDIFLVSSPTLRGVLRQLPRGEAGRDSCEGAPSLATMCRFPVSSPGRIRGLRPVAHLFQRDPPRRIPRRPPQARTKSNHTFFSRRSRT